MPEFDGAADNENRLTGVHILQLILLLSALPLQYWLTTSSSESSRQYELTRFVHSLSDFRAKYLNVTVWITWCDQLLTAFDDADFFSTGGGGGTSGEDLSNSDIVDTVVKEASENGHFSASLESRSPREPHVQYRIGQVVRHKDNKYRGVIIGWDLTAKAPKEWLNKMHPKDRPDMRDQPSYAIVIDTRDRFTPQLAYLAQESVQLLEKPKRIMHPLLDHYFEDYDGKRYIGRPWLKKVYPHDY